MRSIWFIWLALLGLPALSACQGGSAQQRTWLADGERAYQQKEYGRAVQQLTRVINSSGRAEAERALYVRALAQIGAGQRAAARTDLVRCTQTARDPDVRWRAFAVLGTIDFEDGQWLAAARSYAAALATAPATPPTDALLFRLGVCHERSGRWNEACGPYQRIVNEFPQSSTSVAARRRLEIRATWFAVQCGVFAQRENAERLARDLEKDGFAPYLRAESRDGAPVQVVLVGRFRTYEEAVRELARVKGYVPKAVLWP